jgi:hypothetical protein
MAGKVFAALSLSLVGTLAAASSASAAGGDNVLLINVSHVRMAKTLPGLCGVDGTIDTVLKGRAFRRGETISLQVPCGAHTHVMPLLPAIENRDAQLIDPRVLLKSKFAGAHVDDAGNLLWTPGGSYGDWGVIWGYRVMDGTMLPAKPARFS